MRHFKHFLLLVLLFCSTTASAYDFMVDGIAYNINSDGESVEVTSGGSKTSGTLTIPEKVTYNDTTYTVTKIGDSAFYECSELTGSLNIPNSVTSIGERAFVLCSGLTGSLTIPNSVTEIENYAFGDCSNLTSLVIPNSVTKIGLRAFDNCSNLTSVEYNAVNCSGPSSYNDAWFTGCPLETLEIGDKVKTLPANLAYNQTGLTSINIPNSVTEIENNAFLYCSSLTGSLIIPNSVTEIGAGAFKNCSGLTSVTISNSVTKIGNGVFWQCKGLTAVTIPNSVTSIGTRAFATCTGLTSVTIPNSVIEIGTQAFLGCDNISTIYSLNPVPPTCASENVFDTSVYNTAELYVPKEDNAIERYTIDEIWSKFNLIYEKDFSPSTSISEIAVDTTPAKDVYYNLNGQRVINPSNGIFIKNGQKVIIR